MIHKVFRLISLHPKFAATLDALASLIFLWLVLARVMHGWYGVAVWTVLRMIWWVIVSQCMYYPSYTKRLYHWLSLAFFQIGIAGYYVFLEPGLAYALVSLLFIVLPFYSFWLVPEHEQSLPVVGKSHRRWRLMLSAAGIAGLWTGVFAMLTFQIIDQPLESFFLGAFAVLFTSFVTSWWWYEYNMMLSKKFWLLSAFTALLIAQLAYVFYLLPWGFLVAGFTFTWVWYIVWLIVRFHISSDGINWVKQRRFLIINAILLILFLTFIVRWH